MRKGILLAAAMLVLMGSSMAFAQDKTPVLQEVWAPSEINFGDLLKVYVRATDPDGDMRWIVVSAGRGTQPAGATEIRLTKPYRAEVNGYLFWDSHKAASENTSGMAWIAIEDWKGNESATKSVAVKVVPKGAKEQKPPAGFKEVAIGPIVIENPQKMSP